MGQILTTGLEGFRGRILRPSDEGYDSARRVFNGSIDRHPALIARCVGAADVIAAVRFARHHDLEIAVRAGGHSIAGHSVCEGGVMIDLQPMKGIHVDPARRVAIAQPGLTWAEFDHETQAFALVTPGGDVSHTGIAGLTLGGGIGWLRRTFGLTCDNLLAADLVTADGELLTATSSENPELLWGLRGGGGNFGIVTRFTYQLHEVGAILAGMLLYPLERGVEVLRFLREQAADAPDQLSLMVVLITAPPAPFVPQQLVGKPALGVGAAYFGPLEQAERFLRPLRDFGPPTADLVQPMPYVALQSMADEATPAGMQYHITSEMLASLDDAAIDTVLDFAARAPSPMSVIELHQLGGAMSRVEPTATAFPHREAPWMMTVIGVGPSPQDDPEPHLEWTQGLWAEMRRFSSGGAYVNHLGDEGPDRVREAYGRENYDRLVALKDRYDPDNVFHLNQNIQPSSKEGPATRNKGGTVETS